MKKNASNDAEIKIVFTNDSFPDKKPNKHFKWVRASSGNYIPEKIEYWYEYEVDELSEFPEWLYFNTGLPEPGENITVIRQKNMGVEFYNPNLHEISQALMNLDVYDDDEILDFYKKYGPLGIMPYLTNQLTLNFIDYIHREITPHPVKNTFWTGLFGLENKVNFELIETDECKRFVHDFNSLEDKILYSEYHEPLYAIKYIITEYQLNCRLLCSKKTYNDYCKSHFGDDGTGDFDDFYGSYNELVTLIRDETKIVPNLEELKDFRLFAYCNSLLHAVYLYTILNLKRHPLKKCKAPDCLNIFWRENNRREYCSDTCKTRLGVRRHRKRKIEGGE